MKKSLPLAVLIAAFSILFSVVVFGQKDKAVSAAGEMYLISAKAGGVDYVEGRVTVVRKAGKSGLLLKGDTLDIADRVSTGADGRAEILLNPGSFVRLGANARFEMVTTDLENLQLRLAGGSAIFEVFADNEFKVSLLLPKSTIELTKSGVYRVDVAADGASRLAVWKGKVYLGPDKTSVKDGRSVNLDGGAPQIAKFDKDEKDALDVWSQTRAKESAKLNEQLQRQSLRGSLLNSFNRGGWNMYGSLGVWVFNRRLGRWCFLPFGYGWSSPYGYDYYYDLWRCRMPISIYYPPVNPPTTPTGPQTAPIRSKIRPEVIVPPAAPPIDRFENGRRAEPRGGMTPPDNGPWNNTRSRDDSNDSRPVYNPPPPPPAPVTAPIRNSTDGRKEN
ncbi:MAG: FecR domain-containing protein [Acidobacteria bacterium]|nr:FecR domain-containing protein [Acidobacteriota bacterium]